jgi:hypothetical protein
MAAVVAAVGLAVAAPAPPRPATETIKDRKTFIPQRKYQALPGSVVGVLVGDVRAVMGQEGRSGPADAMGFSANGNSYRWIYVTVAEKALINNLTINVGEKGDRTKVYPNLSMASPTTVKQWDINVPYALVEIEVNDNLGSPAQQGFVATRMKRLDGTKDYPLKVADAVADLRKRYERYLKDEKKGIDAALLKEQEASLKDRKPTGPRETAELMYVTWLPKTEHLRVGFRTRISDGAYQYSEGGIRRGPFPLPVPPNRKPGAAQAALPPVALMRPPPPQRFRVRYGTTFGVEFGMAYEVDKSGKVVKILTLPFEGFHQEIPPPPVLGGPRGRLPGGPLPPAPKKD